MTDSPKRQRGDVLRLRQIWTIARLQLLRVFFSKRSFWVYLLALFPSVIFFGHGLDVKIRRERWTSRAVSPAIIESIREGDTDEEVLKRAGKPIDDSTWNRRRRRVDKGEDEPQRRYMMDLHGRRRWNLNVDAGSLPAKRGHTLIDSEEALPGVAAVFQPLYPHPR